VRQTVCWRISSTLCGYKGPSEENQDEYDLQNQESGYDDVPPHGYFEICESVRPLPDLNGSEIYADKSLRSDLA